MYLLFIGNDPVPFTNLFHRMQSIVLLLPVQSRGQAQRWHSRAIRRRRGSDSSIDSVWVATVSIARCFLDVFSELALLWIPEHGQSASLIFKSRLARVFQSSSDSLTNFSPCCNTWSCNWFSAVVQVIEPSQLCSLLSTIPKLSGLHSRSSICANRSRSTLVDSITVPAGYEFSSELFRRLSIYMTSPSCNQIFEDIHQTVCTKQIYSFSLA